MTTEVERAGLTPPRLIERARLITLSLGWTAATLVAIYIGIALWQVGSIIEVASWNADNANMLNMSKELGSLRPSEVVNMGNAPNYTTLWFNAGLHTLGSGTLIEVAPLLWYVLAATLLIWSVWRVAGRPTAMTAAVLLICLSPVSLLLTTSHAVHGPTWFTVAMLGAYAVFVATTARGRSAIAIGLLAGAVAGANVASDPLAAPTAVVPLLLALSGVWLSSPTMRRSLQRQVGFFLGSVIVSDVIASGIGTRSGIGSDLPPGKLATVGQMWASFLQSIENAGQFFGPAPFGGSLSAFAALQLLVGIAGIAGVAVAVRAAWRSIPLRRQVDAETPMLQSRRALSLYWGATLAVGGAVVLTSPLAFEVRESSLRYEFNLFLAGAVALPVWLHSRGNIGRTLASILAIAVAVVGIGGLLEKRADGSAFLRSAMVVDGSRAIDYARARGATRGYAGYWNASGLTWKTGHRIVPVANCATPSGDTLCISPFAVPPHLMRPVPRTKSFILVDHTYPGAPEDRFLKGFGPWDEQLAIGSVFIAIYPYDIASRFGPVA